MGTYHIQEKNVSRFWEDTLSFFCRGLLSFQEECSIQGHLSLNFDPDSQISLNLNKSIFKTNPDVANSTGKAEASRKKDTEVSLDPLSTIHHFLSNSLASFCRNMIDFDSYCIVSGKLCITLDKENAMLIDVHESLRPMHCEGQSSNEQEDANGFNCADIFSSQPIVIEPRNNYEVQTPSKSTDCNTSASKRKRKQLHPTSLSRLEHAPKVIVIDPEIEKPMPKLHTPTSDVPQLLPVQNGTPSLNTDPPQFINAQIAEALAQNATLPLMMFLLKQETFNKLKNGNDVSTYNDINLPPLIQSQTNALNVQSPTLAVKTNVEPKTACVTSGMNFPHNSVSEPQASVSSNVPITLEIKPGRGNKLRHVNNLLELPDSEVDKMLSALMSSGQTKDNCDKQHCNICCPTLAYIRFRDRNRKNKSRFAMEKIEQVVNVQMYGGGTKYRDVQRMFTTYLRKLRAQNMCESKCLCCEKLLLRESKKPNSNYLPHNVVPYKNPPDARMCIKEQSPKAKA